MPAMPLRYRGPRRALETLGAVASVTWKEWAAYRSHMLMTLLIGPAYFLVQYCIWTAVYAGGDVAGGLGLSGMLQYYGVATLVYYLTMDFADWNLQMHVGAGSFVTFLLRPLSHRWFALAQKAGHRGLGFLFEFLPVWLILATGFGLVLIPARPVLALVSVALGFCMTFLINYCMGMSAFWLVRTGSLRSLAALVRDVLAGTFVPLSLLPGPVQWVSFFLPFQYATYVPVRVWLGHYELGGITLGLEAVVGLQALAVLAMWAASQWIWVKAEGKFTGVGT